MVISNNDIPFPKRRRVDARDRPLKRIYVVYVVFQHPKNRFRSTTRQNLAGIGKKMELVGESVAKN